MFAKVRQHGVHNLGQDGGAGIVIKVDRKTSNFHLTVPACVSIIRINTNKPEANVTPAIDHVAKLMPSKSATTLRDYLQDRTGISSRNLSRPACIMGSTGLLGSTAGIFALYTTSISG